MAWCGRLQKQQSSLLMTTVDLPASTRYLFLDAGPTHSQCFKKCLYHNACAYMSHNYDMVSNANANLGINRANLHLF